MEKILKKIAYSIADEIDYALYLANMYREVGKIKKAKAQEKYAKKLQKEMNNFFKDISKIIKNI